MLKTPYFKQLIDRLMLVTALIIAAIAPLSHSSERLQWPQAKPITVIVPYTAGGATDHVTRLVMDKLSARLSQRIIIHNKPGANAIIGTTQLASSPADGYHLGAIIAAHAINPLLHKVPYQHPDFQAISQLAELPMFLFTTKAIPVSNHDELLDYAKQHTLYYGSSGTGSSAHLIGLHFAELNELDMTHVPYQGSAGIIPDLVAGRIDIAFEPLLAPLPYVKSKQLTMLALSASEPWPEASDVPLMSELGYEDFNLSSWVGLIAPKGTPKEIVTRLNREITEILGEEDIRQAFSSLGLIAKSSTASELENLIQRDSIRYQAIIERNVELFENK